MGIAHDRAAALRACCTFRHAPRTMGDRLRSGPSCNLASRLAVACGRTRPDFGQTRPDVCQAGFGQACARSRPRRSKFGTGSANCGNRSAELGRAWQHPARCGPNLSRARPMLGDFSAHTFGRARSRHGRAGSNFVGHIDTTMPEFSQHQPTLVNLWPDLAQLRPNM